MRDDFCAFILTHGRPNNVLTLKSLKRHGYTGNVYLVIDDEDDKATEYNKRFGKKVISFSKKIIGKEFDEGDNFNDRRTIFYARNACFKIAREMGFKYFVQLDDDYHEFQHRFNSNLQYGYAPIRNLDSVFSFLVDFLVSSNSLSVCLAQGGDFIGGKESKKSSRIIAMRKAMNSFVCCSDRQFSFFGRINEDVNTYTKSGLMGGLFFTVPVAIIAQEVTQSNSGGMTDLYMDRGTYLKSFYSVMYSPSCVSIAAMGTHRKRIHHRVAWENCVPVILRENHRKPRPDQALQM